MDGLSIAASVAGLASLALELTQLLRSYYSDVKFALKDVEKLTQEVEALRKVLEQLEAFLNKESVKGNRFDRTASVLASTIKTCETILNDLENRLKASIRGGVRKTIGRLAWPFRKEEVQNTVESLRRYNQIFQFSLTIEGCEVLSQTSEDVSTILQIQLDNSTKLYDITKNISTLSASSEAYLHTAENLAQILQCIRWFPDSTERLRGVSADVRELRLQAREEKDVKILEWLSPDQTGQRHHDVRARRTPGTGKWFLEQNYRAWAWAPLSSMLWCIGAPGTGKTTLMSLVVDELVNTFRGPEAGIAYYYCDYRAQAGQTVSLVIANILRQLLAQQMKLPSSLRILFDRSRRDGLPATTFELADVLRDVCLDISKCFILIDAIDEFDIDAKRTMDFLEILDSLVSAGAKLFVTSRLFSGMQMPERAIVVQISADEADIRACIEQMLDGDEDVSELVDDQLRMEIITRVATQAQGMFLLPVLQIRAILEEVTKSGIRQTLGILPGDLSEAYEKTFQTIQSRSKGQRDLAMRSLMWITYAERPLRVMELQHALATQISDRCFDQDNLPSSKSIVKSCSGLVSVDNENSEIRLVHFTLQSYILSHGPSLFPQAESMITQICLTYMLFDIGDEKKTPVGPKEHLSRFTRLPFLDYAAEHWGDHARHAPTQQIDHLAMSLLTDTSRLQLLFPNNNGITGLHITAKFGLTELSNALLQKGISVETVDDGLETPLHKATTYSRVETATMLLEYGADANAMNRKQLSPLFIATSTGDVRMIEVLLDHGVHINSYGKDSWTALHKAVDCGHYEITKLLLQRGASVTARSSRGLVALHRAAGRGHIDIAKLLLDYGAKIDVVTYDGWSPLHGACSSGQDGIARLLLERGANIHLCSGDRKTPLHRACRGGFSTTVGVLLEHGADPMIKDADGRIPLHIAARGGHDAAIERLLQQNPQQLTVIDTSGYTARGESQNGGFLKTERLLNDMESYFFGLPSQEQGELERAIELQDKEEVEKLLSKGSSVEVPNSSGVPPLHQALKADSSMIAALLLQNGADVSATTTLGHWAPLHYAALNGNPNSVRLCLEHGALVNAQTARGHTALHKACQSGNLETVKVLLEGGADVEARDELGWHPLHTAASSGHELILKTLLDRGATAYARTKDGKSVQTCAALGGHHSLVEFIRELRSAQAVVNSWC